MDLDLSKGERTARPEHVELAKQLAKAVAVQSGLKGLEVDRAVEQSHPLYLPSLQQMADQFSLEADTLYDLTKNSDNFLSPDDWQEAKTKVNALNPDKFRFNGGGGPSGPGAPPYSFVGSPNFWPNEVPVGKGLAYVIHTSVSAMESLDATFASTASQVSATAGIGLDGPIHQYVSVYDAAWANGILESGNRWPLTDGWNPNQRSISVETVDNGDPVNTPVTDEQYASVVWFYRNIVKPAHPEMRWLMGHHSISPLSRSCPAQRWYDSGRMLQLASDTGLELITGP